MNDESDETGVSISSTSLISAQLSSDVRSGMELLEDMLLGRHSSGLVASPFIDAVKNDNAKLQHLVSLHGITSHGLTADDCRVILLRHMFSGTCVSNQCSTRDRTGCFMFSQGFKSAADMSFKAFSILSTATPKQRTNDEILHVFRDLEIEVNFQPKKLRLQIGRELKKQAKNFYSLRCLSFSDDAFFIGCQRRNRASLLAIASAHGIDVDRYTSTINSLKDDILLHFATAGCYKSSLLSKKTSSSSLHFEGCNNTYSSIRSDENLVNSESEFLLQWLTQQKKKLSRALLQRLLAILEIEYKTDDNVKQLRMYLKEYISKLRKQMVELQKNENVNAEKKIIKEKLEKIHLQWPSLVPQSMKDKIITMFRKQTSSEMLKSVTCASCAESCLASECSQVNIHDVDLAVLSRPDRRVQNGKNCNDIVDSEWLDSELISPDLPLPIPSMKDILLDPAGVHLPSNSNSTDIFITLCKSCKSFLKVGRIPPSSIANHMVLGEIPSELKDLTIVEEAMIARCRAKCWIIQLKEESTDIGSSPNAQHGVKGHVIIYPQRPSAIANILPPPIDEISTPICVIFVGSSPPTDEWLQKKAKPLAVRREKVRDALIWLKAHNKLYKDITINHYVLDNLPNEHMLPVHVEHVLPDNAQDSLTSRYDGLQPPLADNESMSNDENNTSSNVSFQNVVITDIDGTAQNNELRAAAVRHVKKKGGGYIEINHDPTPVNEFFNPEMFPMIYPTLFPYGIGGFENRKRSGAISLKHHTKHLFSLQDRRFQEHYSFLFTVFNILQRREILLHTSLKVKRNKFNSVAQSFVSVSPKAVHIVSERVARGDWKTSHSDEERQVLNLMKEVNVITSHVPGSSSARVAMRNEIRALMMEKGLPSFYITINPADVYNPLVKFLAGAEIDIDKLLPEQIPNYWEQSLLIAKNPAVGAKFFDTYMRAFISTILGHNCNVNNLEGGIFGVVNAYYGCVEAQGRGTLHCHMLVWLEGGLNPNEIKEKILKDGDVDFRDRLLTFLDDTIANSIPINPDNDQKKNASKTPHPCSIRGIDLNKSPNENKNDEKDKEKKRQCDLHNLVKQCQLHVHSHTCYKYWKGPLSGEPRECRFNLDETNTCPESSFDSETGELNLRCLDGMVNNFNLTIIEAIRCNMDVKFIGSGTSAKAVLYYITDYITKSQLKSHVAFAALELAVKKLGEYIEGEDEVTVRAKRLLQKCAYAMISHQELSAQQVCSYLMGFGDHYTSHQFRNIYWTAFENFIENEDPSPECYLKKTNNNSNMSDIPNEIEIHLENNSNNENQSIQELDIDEADENSTTEEENEVTVVVKPNGDLIAKTSQVLDYQERSPFLDEICLWDMTAQTEKVRKSKQSELEDNDDYSNYNININIEKNGQKNPENLKDVLTSNKKTRPKFNFSIYHPEETTHEQKILRCEKKFIPVPIGPSIPRRDDDQAKERYCRLMLIMFKPWRHARDLRKTNESWSSAFQTFIKNCTLHYKKIMDNMQILHECRDSRDDHFSKRRNHNKNRAQQLPQTLSRTRENDDDDFGNDDDTEEAILEHLMSIADTRSTNMSKSMQDVIACLKYAEDGGLFSTSSLNNSMVVDNQNDDDGLYQINEEQVPMEQVWAAEYEQRRLQWKKKTCEQPTNIESRLMEDSNSNNSNSLLHDGHAFRMEIPEQNTEIQPSIQQCIKNTHQESDVDMNDVVNKFSLNREQTRAFKIVAEHSIKDKPSALRMYLGGPGGTGKSRVINALKEYFDRRNQSRRFRLSSYTGVAAKNISGMTLHTALCLSQRKKNGISGKTRRDLIAMWEGVDYLFIDEVSMIGCRLLLKISEALNDAKQNEAPFGGINLIFAGDFTQLPPVGETRLFAHINTHDAKTTRGQQNIFGKLLWLSVKTVVILTEIMRQQGTENRQFINLLGRLREGKCTNDDFRLLNSRQLSKSGNVDYSKNPSNAPIIVSNNECKDALNVRATAEFAANNNKPMHWYYASDTRGNKNIEDEKLQHHLESMHSGKTNQRMKKIPLVIGMPVMICQNFDVEHGVVNGCTGKLKKVRYHTDIKGHRHALSCVIEAPNTTGSPLTGIDKQSVVVLQDTTDMKFIHPYSHKICTIKRTQIPIMPAFAMTAHKAQGQTMDKVIVDLESCHGTESPYVMISRVKSLNGLHILRPFNISKIQCRQSEDTRRELQRLNFLQLLTIADLGDPLESARAQEALSKTKNRDQFFTENREENDSHTSDSTRRLHRLQQQNIHLTSMSCPSFSFTETQDNCLNDLNQNHNHSMYFLQIT